MKKFFALIILCIWTNATLGHQLEVKIQDVLDLATYQTALNLEFSVNDKTTQKIFKVDNWNLCTGNCQDYKIKISVEATPIKSAFTEKEIIVVVFKKELQKNNELVRTLQEKIFALSPGENNTSDDYYWNQNALIVRQKNKISLR